MNNNMLNVILLKWAGTLLSENNVHERYARDFDNTLTTNIFENDISPRIVKTLL